jgi:ParB-like chromosome segregation protein Spo0J
MADPKLKITDETRKVAELKADPKNARRHSEAQVAQIASSIERFGFINRIVIRPNGTIIGGHATVEAVRRLSHETIDCRVVAGLTDAQYRALGLALNKIPENSRWDDDILGEVLGELQTGGEDVIGLGFSSKELDSLLGETASLEVKEIATGPVDDEFWISVRGPLKDQAGALKALEQAMKPYAGVTVDLGTINIG